MLTLYDYLPSQNAYKIRLLLNQLNRPYQSVYISIFEGEGQSEEYLTINPTGAVPGLRLEDGRTLAESNAILTFLAEGTQFLSSDPFKRAKTLQWLFFEGDYIQSTVATLRHWIMTGKDKNRPPELLEMKRAGSLKTLSIIDHELKDKPFLAGDNYTIADISVFAYVHLADDANVKLKNYKHLLRWIEDVRAQPGFLDEVHPYSIDPYSGSELP